LNCYEIFKAATIEQKMDMMEFEHKTRKDIFLPKFHIIFSRALQKPISFCFQ